MNDRPCAPSREAHSCEYPKWGTRLAWKIISPLNLCVYNTDPSPAVIRYFLFTNTSVNNVKGNTFFTGLFVASRCYCLILLLLQRKHFKRISQVRNLWANIVWLSHSNAIKNLLKSYTVALANSHKFMSARSKNLLVSSLSFSNLELCCPVRIFVFRCSLCSTSLILTGNAQATIVAPIALFSKLAVAFAFFLFSV